ncbi:MAG: DUF2007 domain-containing protein [Arenicellales bacterium]
MLRVYIAASLAQAHLVQQMLASAGIRSRVLNEYSSGGLGELAATSTWPEVWIDREQQTALARRLIADFESRVDEEKPCAGCGEPNPTTFDICWRCDEPLPVST